MIRVIDINRGEATATDDHVTLDLEARRKRRQALVSAGGTRFLIDLPQAPHLRDGDLLVLDDGQRIAVRAELEEIVEIACDDPVRIAWHLGNRHLPTQVVGDRLRIRSDHVIEAMLEGLGAKLTRIQAPFDPEGGAYAHHHHGQHHSHG